MESRPGGSERMVWLGQQFVVSGTELQFEVAALTTSPWIEGQGEGDGSYGTVDVAADSARQCSILM